MFRSYGYINYWEPCSIERLESPVGVENTHENMNKLNWTDPPCVTNNYVWQPCGIERLESPVGVGIILIPKHM